MAMLAVASIRNERRKKCEDPDLRLPRTAYILRSLKRPEEVVTLRSIYSSSFILVSAYSRREDRVDNLAAKIASSHNAFQKINYRAYAEGLINKDEKETDSRYGQSLRDTFPLADVFLDTTDREVLTLSIERFIETLFGHPYHTPSRDESGMMHAQTGCSQVRSFGKTGRRFNNHRRWGSDSDRHKRRG